MESAYLNTTLEGGSYLLIHFSILIEADFE